MAPPTIFFSSSPATQALELAKVEKEARRGSLNSVDSKLSVDLSALTFETPSNAFPVIQWDTLNESDDSDSVRSMDSWNSLFGGDSDSDSDSDSLLGSKRGRDDAGASSRRLVRSKVIKSDLNSLARSMAAQTA